MLIIKNSIKKIKNRLVQLILHKWIQGLIQLIAIIPILLICSALFLSALILIAEIPLFSNFSLNKISIVLLLLSIILVIYGIVIKKLVKVEEKYKPLYCFSFVTCLILLGVNIFLSQRASINYISLVSVIVSISLLIIHILFNIKNLIKIRQYFQRNIWTFSYLNILDGLLIVLLYFKFTDIMEWSSKKELSISDICIFFIIIVLLSFLRLGAIHFYKKQNDIQLLKDERLFWAPFIFLFSSIIQNMIYILIASEFQKANLYLILSCLSIMIIITTIVWGAIDYFIRHIRITKREKNVLLILLFIEIIAIFLLTFNDSEFITIMTWFMPVLFDNIFGGYHKFLGSHKYVPTHRLEQGLYIGRIISFITLLILNILLSFKFKGWFIKNFISNNSVNLKFNEMLDNIFATSIILLLSVLIGFFLAVFIIDGFKGGNGLVKIKKNYHRKYRKKLKKEN
ncbi:hypothetical protein [Streptococcus sp. sy018]|uniref:hypothetical protein n=1 Tax=Streptococcus sp. sy018 TaxID=2600147 RepID=UPI0011B71E95|nr:hypothetical protein [Streptococcus sp. sy018]TWS95243.1 hypothetical protein FRX52_00115 [Streptococcus sp. sy018]